MAKKNNEPTATGAVYIKNSRWAEAISCEHRCALIEKNFVRLKLPKAADAAHKLLIIARAEVDAAAADARK